MIVAIDGPSAAGKGTLSRMVASHYKLAHLDTGILYRAVAFRLKQLGARSDDPLIATEVATSLTVNGLNDSDLRTQEISQLASIIASMSPVRAALLNFQRNFAISPPNGAKGAVLDGRDIGTVICPDADYKIFVTASPVVRAHRRFLQLRKKGEAANEQVILRETRDRDARDSRRQSSPLNPATDAYLLDTTNLSIDASFNALRYFISGLET